jgi:hypothetical protein
LLCELVERYLQLESQVNRAIAFYLPQYHPIPENDEWWGKGFTEWRNVGRATPQFEGHVQPNLPGELGHYDLRIPEIQRQQVELAKKYGLYGFCFYYYWFEGKRLLEYPLDRYVDDSSIDFPFCLCWANETWTRRWDGGDTDILIKQVYSEKHAEEMFADFCRYLRDSNYIEIDGKKLVLLYRPDDIPDILVYLDTWRTLASAAGMELLICACLTFGSGDPTRQGFDAGVQFPPHGAIADEITSDRKLNDKFVGKIYSYPSVVARQMAEPVPSFPLFQTVMPSWDNTARRMERAHIYADHSPTLFSIWLRDAFEKTVSDGHGNRYAFINAWNEWAEGAFLEPDAQNGLARLEALSAVVNGSEMLRGLALLSEGTISDTMTRIANSFQEEQNAVRNVLRELRSLVIKSRSVYEIYSPVLPTSNPFLSSDRVVFLPGASGSVDRVGSGVFENGVRVDTAKTLFVCGWVLPPTSDIARKRTHMMIIASAKDGASFFFESERFTQRQDIANYMKDWPNELALNSGFELSLAIEDLAPGTYVLTLGVGCGDYVYLLPQRPKMVLSPAHGMG